MEKYSLMSDDFNNKSKLFTKKIEIYESDNDIDLSTAFVLTPLNDGKIAINFTNNIKDENIKNDILNIFNSIWF